MRWGRYQRQTFGMYAMFALGPVFLVLALGYWVNTERFLHRAHRVTGEVLELKRAETSDGDETFRPIFRFVVESGQTYTVESNNGSDPPEFVVGQRVPVVYLPDDPMSARLQSFWQLRASETSFGIFSVCFPLAGLFLRWRRRTGRFGG